MYSWKAWRALHYFGVVHSYTRWITLLSKETCRCCWFCWQCTTTSTSSTLSRWKLLNLWQEWPHPKHRSLSFKALAGMVLSTHRESCVGFYTLNTSQRLRFWCPTFRIFSELGGWNTSTLSWSSQIFMLPRWEMFTTQFFV